MRDINGPRWWAAILGSIVLLAAAGSALAGHDGFVTGLLAILAAPLVYGGTGLPMPRIKAKGIVLSFESPSEKKPAPTSVDRGP